MVTPTHAYLVVGQVQLLDLLVGDALGENVNALIGEDVVREVKKGEVGQLVHPCKHHDEGDDDEDEDDDHDDDDDTGHNVVQQGVRQLAVPVISWMMIRVMIVITIMVILPDAELCEFCAGGQPCRQVVRIL